MKKLLLLLAIACSTASCSKTNYTPSCETNGTGTLLVDSHQPQNFDIYLDGAFLGVVPAHQKKSFEVSTQTYALTARRAFFVFVGIYRAYNRLGYERTKIWQTTVWGHVVNR